MKEAGHVAYMRGIKIAYKIMVRKHEGNKPFGRPRHRLTFFRNACSM
jgi:hypothetical protein